MPEAKNWAFPAKLQPRATEVDFDLERALNALVLLRAEVPEDAFTASVLGTDRVGNGIVIRDNGLVLTIGYLITEARTIWLTANDGRVVPGHALAYDQVTGFGLVLPLAKLGLPPLPLGSMADIEVGDSVSVLGHGGRAHSLNARIIARREFAGYWEYLLDEALFASPAHPQWGGTALIDSEGRLIGVGSLLVQEETDGETVQGNMFVPIDLLPPILDDMVNRGQPARPPRAWLGMYSAESDGRLIVNGLAKGGPADRAGVRLGDLVIEVAGTRVTELPTLFRRVWSLGPAGTDVPITLARDGSLIQITVHSADRNDFLKKPALQ